MRNPQINTQDVQLEHFKPLSGSHFPAAYMGTITGCFLLPRLTIFLVSIPKEHKSFLLLWEPPHWYLSPYASWMSCSSVHTSITTGMEGKQTSNIRSRRLSNVVYTKEKIIMSSSANCFKDKSNITARWKTTYS
uniref:Uncharacterized protein n=1 Tax=Corvus moneduloides TaxID=1196302 RepID=A0A8C3EBS5_CORMO